MDQILFKQPWRHGKDRQGRTAMIHAGTYEIGKTISKELAAQAIKTGVAERIAAKKPVIVTKSMGLAPENKAHAGNRYPTVE